jgi:hypothetical protein
MSGRTAYLSAKLISYTLGGVAYSPPATLYFALFSTAPTATTAGVELTGGNYSRVGKTNDTALWQTQGSSSVSNKVAITFPTASSTWIGAAAFGIYDAAVAGNLLYFYDLSPAMTVLANTFVTLPVGSLIITEE